MMTTATTARPQRTVVRHGMASCRRYGCERAECIEADYQANKRGRLNRQRGIRATVPAAAAHAHIERLVRGGMPLGDVAAHASLSEATIRTVASGRVTDVYRDTASAILAVPVPGPGYVRRFDGVVDATGARRRLRALSALGFPLPLLAGQTGLTVETIGSLRGGRRGQLRMSANEAITAVYDRLWNVDPLSVGVSTAGAAKARAHAVKSGWPSPLAWDDETIDDPTAEPALDAPAPAEAESGERAVARFLAGESVVLDDEARGEAIEHLMVWTDLSPAQIAARMESTAAAVSRKWDRIREKAQKEGRPVPWRRKLERARRSELSKRKMEKAA